MAARNLVTYLGEQQAATRLLPSDTQIVVEQFRDEIGDWRICVLSPFGGRVHSPWALAIEARARERLGIEVSTMVSDDGIVIRLPDAVGGPGGFPGPWDPAWGPDPTAGAAPAWDGSAATLLDVLLPDPDEVEDLVVAELAGSALFASRFRECAARALLLPRRRPGGRTPLWQQRQKAADLLAVASRYGSFPIVLETYRECLRDVFDVPALQDLLRRVAARQVRVSHVETEMASPFSSSLLFDYIAGYMYEGDAPLAERLAAALALDRELLAELIGADELRDLIDPAALADLELELQRLTDDRRARSADDVHDLLRVVGDLRTDEVAARTDGPAEAWLAELEAARRLDRARIAGEERWAAVEDAARLRDGLGVPIPVGLPATLQQSVDRPLVDLVARYARTHGPFVAGDVAARLGLPRDAVELALAALATEQRITAGEFRPGGSTREWCDTGVLRRLRRRSLATLRREVEPVEPQALGRFLPAWQGVGGRPGGVDRTFEVVEQLQGAAIPASVLEHDVLRARVPGYQPAWLDELLASGEVVWAGRGPLGSGDGKVALYLRDQAALLVPPPPLALGDATAAPDGDGDGPGWTDRHRALLDHLTTRGASFWADLYTAAGGGAPEEVVQLLWDLVWAGLVTNDSLHPLRALVGGVSSRPARGGRARRPGRVVTRAGPPAAAGRWSLVADLVAGHVPPTERATAITSALLARHGVLTRDAVTGEDLPGGFATAYSVLKRMEDAGRVRRGYFVEGLGGAQFALPGAVDRLRAERQGRAASGDPDAAPPVVVLAATDPANPYGAALPWPDPPDGVRQRPRRVAGAHVALVDGDLAVFAERGGRSLLAFTSDPAVLAVAAEGLAGLVDAGRVRALQVTRVDGADLADHPLVDALRAAGFADHPRGLVRR